MHILNKADRFIGQSICANVAVFEIKNNYICVFYL